MYYISFGLYIIFVLSVYSVYQHYQLVLHRCIIYSCTRAYRTQQQYRQLYYYIIATLVAAADYNGGIHILSAYPI